MDDDQKTINRTISDYNLIADKFSSTRESVSSDLLAIAQRIFKDQSVLDYGCGNGRMAQFFSPHKYLGVDPSISLLHFAKNQFRQHKFEQIEPSQFKDEWSFQNIICLSVIHHIPSPVSQKMFARGLYNSLSNGGKLILTSWFSNDESILGLTDVPFIAENTKIIRKVYFYTCPELKQIISDAGFHIIRAEIVPRNKGRYSNIEIEAIK
ncbi:MAG: tRNA (mo5U34)-methyltransferase [bacterium ADurb.Bin212]|nr:MAG: tRNA (mo5U34)-methyltransferase [bacterium ADurb.Bin212]